MTERDAVRRRRLGSWVAALVVVVVVASACGGQGDSGTNAGLGAGAAVELPDVTVRDVGAGTEVRLPDLLPAPRPMLLWFWAPH